MAILGLADKHEVCIKQSAYFFTLQPTFHFMKTHRLRLACWLVLALGIWSCKKTEEPAQSSLSLIAPNGARLAANLGALELTAAAVLESSTSQKTNCTITKISYYPVSEGFLAYVSFRSRKGQEGSFLQGTTTLNFRGAVTFVTPNPNEKSRVADETVDGGTTYTVSCSGNTCRAPSFHLPSGTASCKCSDDNNSGCTMTVTTK